MAEILEQVDEVKIVFIIVSVIININGRIKVKMSLAPIVLFVYARPWHTQQTVEALQKNQLAKQSELFIYSDEAKDESQRQSVNEVRRYIDKIAGFKNITVIKRNKNWGLANSIIDGVTTLVNKYKKIIVLEDDLLTSTYFLRFMNDALEFYKDNNKVMHISGYVFPIDNNDLDDTFFIKPASCWGWSTWDRAWWKFKKDSEYFINAFDNKMIRDFDLNNSSNYFNQIRANKNGDLNTWAIFWYASVFINDGLSLHPKESFVQNIGHDGKSATHSAKTSIFEVELTCNYPVNFTDKYEENLESRKRFEQFFNSFTKPIHKKILNKIVKFFQWK